MTLQELSQYYKLRERLNRDEEILESLRAGRKPAQLVRIAIDNPAEVWYCGHAGRNSKGHDKPNRITR